MFKPTKLSASASSGETAPAKSRTDWQTWLLAAVLWFGTVALYWPVTHHDFVNYDDTVYVTANLHVQSGLTPASVGWAFCHTVSSNWHPLTIMSHMLDCQCYGLKPWGHHLTSLLLHALNSVLLFLLLGRLTGATWRSACVAALFAWHPLHVESVAWVAERKDVLSTCFGFLTLMLYMRYAQQEKTARDNAAGIPRSGFPAFYVSRFYWLACFCFACGLMSKPMLVTWPLVLLLLDYWPLNRMRNAECGMRNFQALVVEKIPFFALAAAASGLTFVVQKQTGAMSGMPFLPFEVRGVNAVVSYVRYLMKMLWPDELAVFYPYPRHFPMGWVMLAAIFLAAVSLLAWLKRRQHPWFLMGWCWYVVTLVPVIGLVQVGIQSMADRYTYIPSVGVLIMVVWGLCELSRTWRYQTTLLPLAGSAALILCFVVTRQQLNYWQDSVTLFEHSLSVTEDNYVARINLGIAYLDRNKIDAALAQFRQAVQLAPNSAAAHNNLGNALIKNGQTDEAISELQIAIRLEPNLPEVHNNLGILLPAKGQTNEAFSEYQEAIRLNPEYVEARNNFGKLLAAAGQTNEAISQFEEVLRLTPNAEAYNSLGNLLAMEGRADEAATQFQDALRLKPDDADADYNFAILLAKNGQTDDAISRFREALRLQPNDPEGRYKLGNLLARTGQTDDAIDQFREAVKLNPGYVEARNNLGSLLMGKGRIDEAIQQFDEAVRLKPDYRDAHYNLANALVKKGLTDEAISHFQTVIRLTPDFGPAHYYLGVALAKKGLLDEAISQLRQAVQLRPNDARAHNQLGEVLVDSGRIDEAINEFQQAIRLKPDYAQASNNLTHAQNSRK